MPSDWGRFVHISLFGESHGPAVGVTVGGLPAGIAVDMDEVMAFMARRAPGSGTHTTARRETDAPQILSGILDGKTTGAPLCAVIQNADTRSGDYSDMETLARPGHADYTGHLRYGGYNDPRGGGHFSGRLTAPLTFAGALAKAALCMRGITVGAHIAAIHGVEDAPFDPVTVTKEMLEDVAAKNFPVFDDEKGAKMLAEIESARQNGDSVGGIVACCALNVPAGTGSPIFGGLESVIASILFAVPAVKAVEFGAGFASASLYGSENNDAFYVKDGVVVTETNNHGGILGGISSGMPITLRVAFKPTPTIAREQITVDYKNMQNAVIAARGRHDPCVVPRAVPVVEAAVALALLDCMLERDGFTGWTKR